MHWGLKGVWRETVVCVSKGITAEAVSYGVCDVCSPLVCGVRTIDCGEPTGRRVLGRAADHVSVGREKAVGAGCGWGGGCGIRRPQPGHAKGVF